MSQACQESSAPMSCSWKFKGILCLFGEIWAIAIKMYMNLPFDPSIYSEIFSTDAHIYVCVRRKHKDGCCRNVSKSRD